MKKDYLLLAFLLLLGCSGKEREITYFELTKSEFTAMESNIAGLVRRYDSDSDWIYSLGFQRDTFYRTTLDFSKTDTVSRSGEGPGEFRRVEYISVSENHIHIFDSVKNTIETFHKNLEFSKSTPLAESVLSIAAHSDSILYASQLKIDEWRILHLSGDGFATISYLHTEKTAELSAGVAFLKRSGPYLIAVRPFTNRAFVSDTRSGKSFQLTNPFLPKQPEFRNIMGNRVPEGSIWTDAFILNETFYMIARGEENQQHLYRSKLGENRWELMVFNEELSGLLYFGGQLLGFTQNGYYRYDFNTL